MGRKERCPRCGSKKFTIAANQKECKVCKFTWTGKSGGKTFKKEKVRF
jgi:transposase-like protein